MTADSRAFILLDSFKEDADRLREMLNGPAKEHLSELINIHDELDGLVGYEGFRDGFILGARLMMEVARGQSRFSEGDRRKTNNGMGTAHAVPAPL